MAKKTYDLLFKLLLIGVSIANRWISMSKGWTQRIFWWLWNLLCFKDSGVGKTCILFRFSDDAFTSTFISTIGEWNSWETWGFNILGGDFFRRANQKMTEINSLAYRCDLDIGQHRIVVLIGHSLSDMIYQLSFMFRESIETKKREEPRSVNHPDEECVCDDCI